MFTFGTYGDWSRAGVALRGLSKNMTSVFTAVVDKDGEMIRERLVGHIDSQDLGWTPLADSTVILRVAVRFM